MKTSKHTPDEVLAAVRKVKESPEFKAVTDLLPYTSSPAIESHGTLRFKAIDREYMLYQDGSMRGWKSKEPESNARTIAPYRIQTARQNIHVPSKPYTNVRTGGREMSPSFTYSKVVPKPGLPSDLYEKYLELLRRFKEFLLNNLKRQRKAELK